MLPSRTDGLVDSREAARIYGCVPKHLTDVMRWAGVKPEKVEHERSATHRVTRYYWKPEDVLRVRGERQGRWRAAVKSFTAKIRSPRTRKQIAILSRAGMLEHTRQRILARIAAREASCSRP